MVKAVSQINNLKRRISELEQELKALKGFKSIKRDQSEFTGNKTQLRMLLEASDNDNVTDWNKWRKKNPGVRPNLRGADLSDCSLLGVNLAGAILNNASLDYPVPDRSAIAIIFSVR